MSLQSAKLSFVSTELSRLDATVGAMLLHVRFLGASVEQIEERLLLETVNQLRREVVGLHSHVLEVTGELKTVKRSGVRDAAVGGRMSSASGLSRRVQRQLTELHDELGLLSQKAEERLNAPGRYGDASLASGPYFELMSFLQNLGEFLAKAVKR